MSIRAVILEQVSRIAEHQGRTLAPLNDNVGLLNCGLDSLCIAILVATLDDELGLDPLSHADGVAFPVTLGDFIALYEHAAV